MLRRSRPDDRQAGVHLLLRKYIRSPETGQFLAGKTDQFFSHLVGVFEPAVRNFAGTVAHQTAAQESDRHVTVQLLIIQTFPFRLFSTVIKPYANGNDVGQKGEPLVILPAPVTGLPHHIDPHVSVNGFRRHHRHHHQRPNVLCVKNISFLNDLRRKIVQRIENNRPFVQNLPAPPRTLFQRHLLQHVDLRRSAFGDCFVNATMIFFRLVQFENIGPVGMETLQKLFQDIFAYMFQILCLEEREQQTGYMLLLLQYIVDLPSACFTSLRQQQHREKRLSAVFPGIRAPHPLFPGRNGDRKFNRRFRIAVIGQQHTGVHSASEIRPDQLQKIILAQRIIR